MMRIFFADFIDPVDLLYSPVMLTHSLFGHHKAYLNQI